MDDTPIEELNFTPLSDAGAEGKPEPREPLPQMQQWKGCTITGLKAYDPFPDPDAKNPVTKRLCLTIDTAGQHPEPVLFYLNWWEGQSPNEKSTWHQVNCAVWPKVDDRKGKVPTDWIGEQVMIMTVPADKDPNKTKVILKPNSK